MQEFTFLFFGTSNFSLYVLESLKKRGILPKAVVTFLDKPQGRKMILTPNPVKKWAEVNNINIIESDKFKTPEIIEKIKYVNADVFVVASFGKILIDDIIYMPRFKTLNVHPSLLPKLRGPAPIQGAILKENNTGVTVMRLSSKMDEGPIIAQHKVIFPYWPLGYKEAEKILGEEGGTLLGDVLPKWIKGEIEEIEQDPGEATYTKMINKLEADITNDSPEYALRKIKAFEVWPRARLGDLIVTEAHLENDNLKIDRVIPPGKNEVDYAVYLKNK